MSWEILETWVSTASLLAARVVSGQSLPLKDRKLQGPEAKWGLKAGCSPLSQDSFSFLISCHLESRLQTMNGEAVACCSLSVSSKGYWAGSLVPSGQHWEEAGLLRGGPDRGGWGPGGMVS